MQASMLIVASGLPLGSTLDSVQYLFSAFEGITVVSLEECCSIRTVVSLLGVQEPLASNLLGLGEVVCNDSRLSLTPWASNATTLEALYEQLTCSSQDSHLAALVVDLLRRCISCTAGRLMISMRAYASGAAAEAWNAATRLKAVDLFLSQAEILQGGSSSHNLSPSQPNLDERYWFSWHGQPTAAMVNMLQTWYLRAQRGAVPDALWSPTSHTLWSWQLHHSLAQLPEVHAACVAAAKEHWALPRNSQHGDRWVVLRLLHSPPPSFISVFPYLVGHEYRTRSGVGDLLYTNGYGLYAAVEAKQLVGVLKQRKPKKQVAQKQAVRYAADAQAWLPHAVAVLPFIAYLCPGPGSACVLGKRKRQSTASRQKQAAAAGARPAVVGVELVAVKGQGANSRQLYRALELTAAKVA